MKTIAGAASESPFLRRLAPVLSLALFAVAVAVAYREVHVYPLSEIRGALISLPEWVLVLCIGIMLIGYLVLSLYDWLALEYAGERLAYRRVLLTSLLSYAIGNNVGHAMISGGSIRYRFYSSWDIPATSIIKVVLFCTATYAIGALTLLLAGYAAMPDRGELSGSSLAAVASLAAVIAALTLLAWWMFVLFWRRPVAIRGFSLGPPAPSLAMRQTMVAVTDLTLASLVLYLPLSLQIELPYPTFLVLYLTAQVAGTLSLIPGGIGVFEGSFLFLSPGQFPGSEVLAALIVYRVVYYFLPLIVAGGALAAYELKLHRLARLPAVKAGVNLVESAIPQILAVLLLLGAGVLLLSGASPAIPERLEWLHFFLPLPLIEFSHLTGSLAGVLLLLLSRAVSQRIDSAYYATIGTMCVGIVASLAKGWDYEEAGILSALLLMVLSARKHFYRKSALLSLDFPLRWVMLSGVVIGLSLWLGLFSYRHVEYSGELWWQFALHGNAPRFLRSAVAMATLVGGLVIYRLLTRPAAALALPSRSELERTVPIIDQAADTMAHLALVGDKRLLWSDSSHSFLCFDTTPGFWIAMGDPVGVPAETEGMIWKFREMADRHNAGAVFYQVSTMHLPVYLDLGAVPVKLGEEARVRLVDFALEGKRGAKLRNAYNKLKRDGLGFDVIPHNDVDAVLPELRTISDRWLATKRVREKRFSLGFFDSDYLRCCDVAVLRRDRTIVAFANLWYGADKEELSLDLMRYDPSAPNGVMEHLTVCLMLWGKAQGFQWFSLGMAPLSGLERRPLAPLWHKVGNVIFDLGSEFYNFEGLYHYKNKFDPEWRPRYLIVPSGMQLAPALLAVTSLISGGLKGVFAK